MSFFHFTFLCSFSSSFLPASFFSPLWFWTSRPTLILFCLCFRVGLCCLKVTFSTKDKKGDFFKALFSSFVPHMIFCLFVSGDANRIFLYLFVHLKHSLQLREGCYLPDELLCLKVPLSVKSLVLEENRCICHPHNAYLPDIHMGRC